MQDGREQQHGQREGHAFRGETDPIERHADDQHDTRQPGDDIGIATAHSLGQITGHESTERCGKTEWDRNLQCHFRDGHFVDPLEECDLEVADAVADKSDQSGGDHIDPERALGGQLSDRVGNTHFSGFGGRRRIRITTGRFLDRKQENQTKEHAGDAKR